jgi:capsular exopolysaccharide synthesis family protein
MGKVYDALRRAESQRTGRAPGAAGIPAAPLDRPVPERPHAAPRAPSQGRLARWTRRLRPERRPTALSEDAGAINKRRITLLHPDSFIAEQFRTLRARLDALAGERPLRTLAITSALPGEGKTTAAINLAVVSALSVGRRVLLVDCDLRRPKIHSALGLRPEFGLAEVLTGQVPLSRAVQKVDGTNLEVLAVRSTPPNPSELLASESMRALMAEMATGYDQVILDTPPTLALPDAKTLTGLADAFMLVVRADSTPQDDVQTALDVLDRRRVLGLLLNGAETDAQRYGY